MSPVDFYREDRRWPGPDAEQDYRWQTTVFRYRRRALGRAELRRLFTAAGFADIATLSTTSHHWQPFELRATELLAGRGVAADFDPWDEFALEDTDHEWLDTPAYDGIEDSAVGQWLGVGHLRYDEWFLRFQPP